MDETGVWRLTVSGVLRSIGIRAVLPIEGASPQRATSQRLLQRLPAQVQPHLFLPKGLSMSPRLVLCLPLLVLATGLSHATGVADNFESYAPGSFPGPLWRDVAALDPQPPAPPGPSARVALTTNAAGAPTQALMLADAVTLVSGIYQPVPVSDSYSLAADIRIDRYSNNSVGATLDFPMQLTFAQTTRNLYGAPQAGVYASSRTGGWRLFLAEDVAPGIDLDLGVVATPGIWYRVTFDLDTTTGGYRVRIDDVAAGTSLLDRSDSFAGWSADFGNYDAVAFFSGHDTLNPDVTVANLASVDNINVSAVPEPPAAAVLLAGLAVLALRRRARRHQGQDCPV